MTRDELVTYTKHLLAEDAATTALASDANFQSTVDIANKTVWQTALDAAPSIFETRSVDLTYVPSVGYNLASLESNAGIYELKRVYLKNGSNYLPLTQFAADEHHIVNATSGGVCGYYVEGEYLYLVTKPTENKTLRLIYLPNLPTMAGSTQALGAKTALTTFHPLVAYEAALVLGVKDEAAISGLKLVRDEMKKALVRHLNRRRVRHVKEVPFA